MFNDKYASLNAEDRMFVPLSCQIKDGKDRRFVPLSCQIRDSKDRRFVPLSCQIKDGKIGICCFFAKEVSL
jgi:hypothetical protein